MLIIGTAYEWAGWPEREKQCIINTRRISMVYDMLVGPDADGEYEEGSRFLYSSHEGHRRGNLQWVEFNKTSAELNTASELVPLNDFYMVLVYPDNDITGTGTFVEIKVRDIIRIATASPTTCWLWVQHNEVRVKRYRVSGTMNWHMAEIYSENN